jgi:hypothetical protein
MRLIPILAAAAATMAPVAASADDARVHTFHCLGACPLGAPENADPIVRLRDEWQPDKIIIEDAASGPMLYQELHKFKRILQPLMWRPVGSKSERMRGQLGQIEDGRVLLPEDAPFPLQT